MTPYSTNHTQLDDWGPDVARLHRETLTFDAHNDAIVGHIRRGNLPFNGAASPAHLSPEGPIAYLRERHQQPTPVQLNLPLMRAGGLDVAYCAVDCTRAWKNHMAYALDGWGWLAAEVEHMKGDAMIASTAAELLAAKAAGQVALVLTLENSEGLEKSLHALRMMHRMGVRAVTLTHNVRTWAGDGNWERESGGGLTTWGHELVKELNTLGMLVDVSHGSPRTFWDVMDSTRAPVIATHSCCKAVCDHPRNLDDEQLKAIAQLGGVVGITFVPDFIHPSAPTMALLLDHIDHAVQMAGIDHVGLGSDFDGGGDFIRDASQLPGITAGLLERGYAPEAIQQILGGNHLRLFRTVCG